MAVGIISPDVRMASNLDIRTDNLLLMRWMTLLNQTYIIKEVLVIMRQVTKKKWRRSSTCQSQLISKMMGGRSKKGLWLQCCQFGIISWRHWLPTKKGVLRTKYVILLVYVCDHGFFFYKKSFSILTWQVECCVFSVNPHGLDPRCVCIFRLKFQPQHPELEQLGLGTMLQCGVKIGLR